MGLKPPLAHQNSRVAGLVGLNQVSLLIVVDLVITASSVFQDLLLIQFQTPQVDE